MMPSLPTPKPGHLFLPGCAIAAGLLTVSLPTFAAPTAAPASSSAPLHLVSAGADTLRVGETVSLPLPGAVKVQVESGTDKVLCITEAGNLSIKALGAGEVKIRLEAAGRAPEVLTFQITPKKARTTANNPEQYVMRREAAQLVARAQTPTTTPGTPSPLPDFLRDIPAPTRGTGTPVTPPGMPTPEPTVVPSTVPATPTTDPLVPVAPLVPAPGDPTALPPLVPVQPLLPTGTLPPTDLPPTTTVPDTPPPAVLAPDTPPPAVYPPVAPPTVRVAPPATRSVPTFSAGGAQVGPNLPPPSKNVTPKVTYTPKRGLPSYVKPGVSRSSVPVSQGLARLLTFNRNILSVFFSDPKVMDARAINARTIAVTGIGAGESTLAVFTAEGPDDVIGTAHIYRIQTVGRGPVMDVRDPAGIQQAIESALNDPRIRVNTYRVPDGSISARLTGTVRNDAEVQGAVNTARLYVPQPISALYADPNALTLEQAIVGPQAAGATPLEELQGNLRRITGNDTIELAPLGTGLGLKAVVNSPEEAEQLLRVVPTLNQQVMPFIIVRGAATVDTPYYNSTIPLLQGEDLQLTQKLQAVTGVRTVYAVRTAGNAVAIYGNVRTRAEYLAIQRYAQILPQLGAPAPVQGTTQGGATVRPTGQEGALPSYNPTGGYQQQIGVQMFVRITDPAESTIRNVTVDTSIVEITHQALRNLGVQYGTATTLTETVTGGTTTRTIDPSFNQGSVQLGNGFAGLGGRSQVDPFRARIDALVSNGDARILSNPNVSALEGNSAQITIGGERPVPAAVSSIGSTGQSVEFRRFGVIITMRPTVTDDNNIILQIRADVTQPDSTYQINLNGALIPGETVRSVDTTLTVRPGDVVVMGGLINNEKRQQTSKVPVLGDLPIIGSLFRSRRFENNETELAIFMTPHLDFIPASPGALEYMKVAPSFPALPGRQESNAIFQNNSRSGTQ